jgi:ATP-dependent Clp protease ATP-binding subunit ClpC
LQGRLSERKLQLEITDAAKSWLAKVGFDPIFGARPLRRAVERYVENPLSTKVLRGEFNEGDVVTVDLVDDNLTFTARAAEAVTT